MWPFSSLFLQSCLVITNISSYLSSKWDLWLVWNSILKVSFSNLHMLFYLFLAWAILFGRNVCIVLRFSWYLRLSYSICFNMSASLSGFWGFWLLCVLVLSQFCMALFWPLEFSQLHSTKECRILMLLFLPPLIHLLYFSLNFWPSHNSEKYLIY